MGHGRVPRGGRLLRPVRIPHHQPAAGGMGAGRPHRPAVVLEATGPSTVAGAAVDGRRDHPGGANAAPGRRASASARRRTRCAVLRRELADDPARGRLLRPDRIAVTPRTHVVSGHRGAVLPGLATARGRTPGGDRGCRRAAGRAPSCDPPVRDRCRRVHRAAGGALSSRGPRPGLLRHRHPGGQSPDRCRAGHPHR